MDEWVSKRVGVTLNANKLVSKAMGDEFEKLLKGKLSERQLRPTEVADVAKSLLAKIETISPKPEGKK